MTKVQKLKVNSIIHVASLAAGAVGAGLAQIPTSDCLVITPMQVVMIVAIGKAFGKKLTESAAKTWLGRFAEDLGRKATQVAVGWYPVYGNAINAATAIALTEAIGWAAARDFDNGRKQ